MCDLHDLSPLEKRIVNLSQQLNFLSYDSTPVLQYRVKKRTKIIGDKTKTNESCRHKGTSGIGCLDSCLLAPSMQSGRNYPGTLER